MPSMFKSKFLKRSKTGSRHKSSSHHQEQLDAGRRFSEPVSSGVSSLSNGLEPGETGSRRTQSCQTNHVLDGEAGRRVSTKSAPCMTTATSVCSGSELLHDHRWRMAEISKLDDYMKNARETLCDDELSRLPNRLCCAQLLRECFLREERQYFKDLLHGKVKPPSRHPSKVKVEVRRRKTGVVALADNFGDLRLTSGSTNGSHNMAAPSLRSFSSSPMEARPTECKYGDNEDCCCEDFNDRKPSSKPFAPDDDFLPDSDYEDEDFAHPPADRRHKRQSKPVFPPDFEIY